MTDKKAKLIQKGLDIVLILGMFYTIFGLQLVKKQVNMEYHYKITGIASWYAKGKYRDGSVFKGNMMSCASDYFPRYSLLLVKDIATGRKTIVYNNDFHEATDIIIDLSKKAFGKLRKFEIGKIVVEVTYLGILKKPNEEIFGREQKW